MQAVRNGWLRRLAFLLARSGDIWVWTLLSLVAWRRPEARWRTRGRAIGRATLVAALVTLALKGLFRRQRPPGSSNRPYLGPDAHSFPSGHACRAMAVATALSPLVGPVARPLLFFWAILVGLSRVALGVHHLSDAVAGLLVGWGVGRVSRPGLRAPASGEPADVL